MDKQLTRLGITYERIPALLGTDPHMAELYDGDAAERATGYRMSDGEAGCAASHRLVYERMLERGEEYALVLEDDVELPGGFKEILEREIERNAGDWEFLSFNYWEPGTPTRRFWFHSIRTGIVRARKRSMLAVLRTVAVSLVKGAYVLLLFVFEGWRNEHALRHPGPVRFYRPLYLAGAYLITVEGARKLLSLATPLRYPADMLPNLARTREGLRFRAYAPLCVRQLKSTFGSRIIGISGDEYTVLYPEIANIEKGGM
jgi:GR25 family glycosyltransferase involved in LPS biosynthesis